MKVFELLIKIFFLAAIIPIASLRNNAKFDCIVFCFRKYAIPVYHWRSSLLNRFYGKKMSTPKYENLFTSNTKTELKANVLTLINKWILDEAQMESDHGAGSAKARATKELLKMEKSPLSGLYIGGDYEQIEDNDGLIDYINHDCVPENFHNHIKAPSCDRKFLVIFKETSTLFPVCETITGKDWTEILDKATTVKVSDPVLTAISTTLKSIFNMVKKRKI